MGTAVVNPQTGALAPGSSSGATPDSESYWSVKPPAQAAPAPHQEAYWSAASPAPAAPAPAVPSKTAPATVPSASRPMPEMSAYEPSWMDRARTSVANSAIGHSLESTAPGIADALNLHPSEAFGSEESQQDKTSLPSVTPLLPSWATQPLLPRIQRASDKIDRALGYGPKIDQNKSALADYDRQHPVVAGIAQGVGNTLDDLSSPLNLAQVAFTPESKVLSGIFAAQAAKGSYDSAQAAYEAYKAGNNKEAAQMATQALASGAVAGLAGSHALRTDPTVTIIPPESPSEALSGGTRQSTSRQTKPSGKVVEGEPPASGHQPQPSNPSAAPPTHPSGTVTGYDQTTGLPIVDRTQSPAHAAAQAALTGKPMEDIAKAAQEAPLEPPATIQGTPEASTSHRAPSAAPQVSPSAPREAVQASSDPEALRQSAQEQEPALQEMAEGAIEGVPGAKVEGVRVKSADSIDNKDERGKPPDTNIDNLGARVSAPTPEGVEQIKQNIEQQLPIVQTDKITNNGLNADQYGIQTGKQGELNQVSEVQVVTSAQAKAMRQTDSLYARQKEAVANGDQAEADRIGQQIQSRFDEAKQDTSQQVEASQQHPTPAGLAELPGGSTSSRAELSPANEAYWAPSPDSLATQEEAYTGRANSPVDVEVNHAPPRETAASWKRASENKDLARQFERTGLKGFSIEAPHKFGLSEQGNISREAGRIEISANASDPEHTIAHEVAHEIYARLSDADRQTVDAYMRNNPQVEESHAGGLEERISDHFAKVLQGKTSVPEDVQRAFFEGKLSPVERHVSDKSLPKPEVMHKTKRDWDQVAKTGGHLMDSDDIKTMSAEHGDRMLVVKDVNGGRHLLPASVVGDLEGNSRFSGNVRSIWMARNPTDISAPKFDGQILNYLPDMARGIVEARPDLRSAVIDAAPGLESKLPAAGAKSKFSDRNTGLSLVQSPAKPADALPGAAQRKLRGGQQVILPDGSVGTVKGGSANFSQGGRWSVQTSGGEKTIKGSALTAIAPLELKYHNTGSALEKATEQYTIANGPKLVAQLLKDNRDADGVPSIATDAAKFLFPEYRASPTTTEDDVRGSAHAIQDAALRTELARPVNPDRSNVLISTGTPASGKTSGQEAIIPHAGLKYEMLMTKYEDAEKLVQQVIDSGRNPIINVTFLKDPRENVRRMITRAVGTEDEPGIKRTVPVNYIAESFLKIPAVVQRLKEHFADRIQVTSVDNSGKPGEAQAYTGIEPALENASKWTLPQLQEELYGELDKLSAAGQVPADTLARANANRPVRTAGGRDSEGDSGRAEQAPGERSGEVLKASPTRGGRQHKLGNTQADIHPESEAGKALSKVRNQVDRADLMGDGLVHDSHVTVRYGIDGEDTAGIRAYLEKQPPFEASLGRTAAFPASEYSEGAVPIIAPVKSLALDRMNREIEKHGNFTEPNFAEYKPHATVAYVKPDAASKYTDMEDTEGKRFLVDAVTIAKRDGSTEVVPLKGTSEGSKSALSDRDRSTHSPKPSELEKADIGSLKPGSIATLPRLDLTVDPRKFQYKLNPSAEGITNQLTGKKWNDDLAGVIQAWRDPDSGKIYVVNGHHRVEMARRSGVKDMQVRLIDAPDAQSARAVGALQNIAEGRGTPVDAAKFFRDSGYTPERLDKLGISMGESTATNGLALARLGDPLFEKVATGKITQGRAIAIGKATADHAAQDAIVKMVDRAEARGRNVSDATVAELARFASAAPTHEQTSGSLFGKLTQTQNLAIEKAEVSSYIQRELAQEKRVFGSVASESKARTLSTAGNTIKAEQNARISADAAQSIEAYNRLSTRTGEINDALDEAAKAIAAGTKPAEVKQRAYERVREFWIALRGRAAGSDFESVRPDQARLEAPTDKLGTPTLPGMAKHVEADRASASEEQGKALTREMQRTPESVDRSAGEMERKSPLFSDSEANPQSGLFRESSTSKEPLKTRTDLGSKFYSGFGDPELFDRLFPDAAQRVKDWIADEPDAGDKQRAMMRDTRGEMDRRVAIAQYKLRGASKEWRARPREDSIKFWNAVEQGETQSLSPKDRDLADLFKGSFDHLRADLQQLKPEVLQNYIENYFPHLWEQQSAVSKTIKQVLSRKKTFAGDASFLKQRTIPTMQDGLDLGLKPKSWNPVDSFLTKYSEMAQFLMGHQTMAAMKEAGTAKMVRVGQKPPDGWMQLDDRIGTVYGREQAAPKTDSQGEEHDGANFTVIRGHYYAPVEAARVFNNFVSRGIAGRWAAYDIANSVNQNINALQLGISAFHATTTSVNAATSDIALGIQQLAEGKPLRAGLSIARGASTIPSIINTAVNGSRLMREYLNPGSYAKFSEEAKALAQAGGRIKQNTLEIKPLDRVVNAWRNGAVKEGLTAIPAAILHATVAPVMEHYVPKMKVGAFYAMAHDILDQAGKNSWTQEQTRTKMQQAWDSVDNRFGQMVYDNLFWHKGLRDALNLATRSVGWNFGDIRELGGAAVDSARAAGNVASGKAPTVTPRMAFAMALPMYTALLGGVLTYLWTGKRPENWKDYFYPKTADGQRHSIPGYMKDVVSFGKHPVDTTLNKLAPIWTMTSQAINNRDFYGTEIRHKDDPTIQQFGQFSRWAGQQAIPFSFSGAEKLLKNRGAGSSLGEMLQAAKQHPGDVALGQFGFQSAPAYIQNSEAMTAARDYNAQNRPPGTRTQEQSDRYDALHAVQSMYRSGNVDNAQIDRYVDQGKLSEKDVTKAEHESDQDPIVTATRDLSVEQFLSVYSKGTEAEKEALWPHLVRKQKEINKMPDGKEKDRLQEAYDKIAEPAEEPKQIAAPGA
jgi:ParB-like chromosome segregation protein Spo0J